MGETIPLIIPFLGDDEADAAALAVRSGWVAQGPRVAAFEAEFAATVQATDAVAVSSATAGLHLAMVALGLGPGDEVITPSLSFIASANAPRYVGATPVFADVDPVTFNVTVDSIAAVASDRTRAVIVVHQLGMPADLEPIQAWCEERGIAVVEDAACAIGSTYRGRPIGGHSNLVVFSFHPRKLVTTGEGGMVAVARPDDAARLRRLRQHGMSVDAYARARAGAPVTEEYVEAGFNYRMTDIQASIGLVQLAKLPAMIEHRRDQADVYRKALDGLVGVTTPTDPPHGATNYQSYAVRIDEDAGCSRDEAIVELRSQGIASKPALMAAHLEPTFRGHPHGALEITESIHREGLLLPLYHTMTADQQERVTVAVTRAVS
jgi:dTDP-4-amino-4,6-dideoxygalactose transaminase